MILILEKVVSGVIFFYQFLIFVRVLLTWVNPDPYRPTIDHPLIRLLSGCRRYPSSGKFLRSVRTYGADEEKSRMMIRGLRFLIYAIISRNFLTFSGSLVSKRQKPPIMRSYLDTKSHRSFGPLMPHLAL